MADAPDIPMGRIREAWRRAASFPADKEGVYPDHAEAQEFDRLRRWDAVLEYGCGGGSDTMSYLRRGCQVNFVDVVPENVECTRRRTRERHAGSANGWVLEGSAALGFFPDGAFDIVNAHGVLHHIPEPAPVVREFFRVLKRGGRLYAMLYTEALFDRCLPAMRAHMAAHPEVREWEAFAWCTDDVGAPYARAYTEAEGRWLLEDAGFEVRSTFVYNGGDFRTYRATKP